MNSNHVPVVTVLTPVAPLTTTTLTEKSVLRIPRERRQGRTRDDRQQEKLQKIRPLSTESMARGHQSVALKALKTKHTSDPFICNCPWQGQIKIVLLHVCPRGSSEPEVGTVLNGFAMEIIFEASDRETKRVKVSKQYK